jgi:hypothetical protein
MEPAYAADFARVQAVCEQARQEMRLTKGESVSSDGLRHVSLQLTNFDPELRPCLHPAIPLAFEDGFNLVCSRLWGKRVRLVGFVSRAVDVVHRRSLS